MFVHHGTLICSGTRGVSQLMTQVLCCGGGPWPHSPLHCGEVTVVEARDFFLAGATENEVALRRFVSCVLWGLHRRTVVHFLLTCNDLHLDMKESDFGRWAEHGHSACLPVYFEESGVQAESSKQAFTPLLWISFHLIWQSWTRMNRIHWQLITSLMTSCRPLLLCTTCFCVFRNVMYQLRHMSRYTLDRIQLTWTWELSMCSHHRTLQINDIIRSMVEGTSSIEFDESAQNSERSVRLENEHWTLPDSSRSIVVKDHSCLHQELLSTRMSLY